MIVKYELEVNSILLEKNFKRLINLTYKLLPMREEGGEWEKLLETILEELVGLDRLCYGSQSELFILICKLEGLFALTEESNFNLYRRVIFECLTLLNELKNELIK